MRSLLLLVALGAAVISAAEQLSPALREKVHARILESLPAPAASTPPPKPAGDDEEVVVLAPVIVQGSRDRTMELAREIDTQQRKRVAEKFSAAKGGTIYRNDRLELGGWWNQSTGWSFFKLKW